MRKHLSFHIRRHRFRKIHCLRRYFLMVWCRRRESQHGRWRWGQVAPNKPRTLFLNEGLPLQHGHGLVMESLTRTRKLYYASYGANAPTTDKMHSFTKHAVKLLLEKAAVPRIYSTSWKVIHCKMKCFKLSVSTPPHAPKNIPVTALRQSLSALLFL